jgi:hypothetical protein
MPILLDAYILDAYIKGAEHPSLGALCRPGFSRKKEPTAAPPPAEFPNHFGTSWGRLADAGYSLYQRLG